VTVNDETLEVDDVSSIDEKKEDGYIMMKSSKECMKN
jgi:hypothetical protein